MNPKVARSTKGVTPPPTHLNFLKLRFAILVGIYGIVCALSPLTYRFLDWVDLVFHEAGHAIFGFFGEFTGVLGGSLMQLLIHAIGVGYFLLHQPRYSAAVTLFWVAQSLFRDSRATLTAHSPTHLTCPKNPLCSSDRRE